MDLKSPFFFIYIFIYKKRYGNQKKINQRIFGYR